MAVLHSMRKHCTSTGGSAAYLQPCGVMDGGPRAGLPIDGGTAARAATSTRAEPNCVDRFHESAPPIAMAGAWQSGTWISRSTGVRARHDWL
jgi:hypothetical protein